LRFEIQESRTKESEPSDLSGHEARTPGEEVMQPDSNVSLGSSGGKEGKSKKAKGKMPSRTTLPEQKRKSVRNRRRSFFAFCLFTFDLFTEP